MATHRSSAHRRPAPRGQAASPVGAMATEWPIVLVLACGTTGVLVAGLGPVRTGILILAGTLLLGALLRFALPTSRAGLLAVRRRGTDVIMMGSLALLIFVLALLI